MSLVDRFLAKAEAYEKKGNQDLADKFFHLAEKAEVAYRKIQEEREKI